MAAQPPASAEGDLVMGFDFGMAKIGVAVGQGITQTASPLGIVPATRGRPAWAALDALLKEWAPKMLVVGLPINMDDTPSEMAAAARRFAGQLESRYRLPAQMIDERLTSFEAKTLATEKDAPLDDLAACLILETWLRDRPA